jgi:hypothetical protein
MHDSYARSILMAELTQATLKESLRYEPKTGVFYSLVSGKLSGYVDIQGYVIIQINYNKYKAHRLVFLWENGEFPPKMVDHIDGNRANNKLSNLRYCDNQQNQRNRKRSSDNTSGHKGVSWDNSKGRWRVTIRLDNSRKHLGYYKDLEQAAKVACKAQAKHFKEFNYTGI